MLTPPVDFVLDLVRGQDLSAIYAHYDFEEVNASKHNAMGHGRMVERGKELKAEIDALVRQAEDRRHGNLRDPAPRVGPCGRCGFGDTIRRGQPPVERRPLRPLALAVAACLFAASRLPGEAPDTPPSPGPGVAHFDQVGVSFDYPADIKIECEPGSPVTHIRLDHSSSFYAFIEVFHVHLSEEERLDAVQRGMESGWKEGGGKVQRVVNGTTGLCGAPRTSRTIAYQFRTGTPHHMTLACIDEPPTCYLVGWTWSEEDEQAASAMWDIVRSSLHLGAGVAPTAEVVGARLELPPGWTPLDRAPSDLVQARFISPTQTESASLGSFVLPRTPIREFVACGLSTLRDGVDVDSMASRVGVSKEEFLRITKEHAGEEVAHLFPELGKSVNATLLDSQWTVVDSRRAFSVRTHFEVGSIAAINTTWIIEGYSLGELLSLSVATRGEDSALAEDLVRKLHVIDSRVVERGIPGFELKWPRGAFVVPGKGKADGTSGVVQIPLGPIGAVRVSWAWQPSGDATSIRTALQQADEQVRRDAKTRDLQDVQAREWSRGPLSFGSYEFEFHFTMEGEEDAAMWTKALFVRAARGGAVQFTIHAPQQASDAARRLLDAVMETTRSTRDASDAGTATGERNSTAGGPTSWWLSWPGIAIAIGVVLGAAWTLARRRRRSS